MSSFNLNYLLKTLSPNRVTLRGEGLQHQNLGAEVHNSVIIPMEVGTLRFIAIMEHMSMRDSYVPQCFSLVNLLLWVGIKLTLG